MAIDSAAKRAAALGMGRPGIVLPIPDGTIDAADRAHLAGVALPSDGETPALPRITAYLDAGLIPVKYLDEDLLLTFDWAAVLPDGITLASVVHNVPSPLVKGPEANTATTSDIDLQGGEHAAHVVVEMVGTLSNAAQLTIKWPVRCWNE